MTMEFERQPLPLDSFPPNLQNHVKDGAPDKMKMMAAQGMVPAPPAQQLKVLYQLHFDDSVADAATDALTGMPHNVLVPAIEDESAPGVLDWVGDVHDDDQILEALVLNDNTDDATICHVARHSGDAICEIIANNQVRILRSPAIIDALYKNPDVGMATVDSLIELALRNEVDLSEFRELSQAAKGALADDDDGLDDSEFSELLDKESSKASGEKEKLEKLEDESLTRSQREKLQEELAEDFEDEDGAEDTDEEDDSQDGRGDIRQKIRDMNVGQKIRLATVGSREAIKILVKDPNKLVHLAAIDSPRIKLGDVKRLSSKKSLPDGVVEYIAKNRNWTSDYEVMVNLVHNPKTPLSEVSSFLKRMRKNDLKKVTRDRNISHQVQRMAKRMMKRSR